MIELIRRKIISERNHEEKVYKKLSMEKMGYCHGGNLALLRMIQALYVLLFDYEGTVLCMTHSCPTSYNTIIKAENEYKSFEPTVNLYEI